MLVFPATFDPLEMGVGTDFYRPVPHSELEKEPHFSNTSNISGYMKAFSGCFFANLKILSCPSIIKTMSETSHVFNISGIKFCSICTKILHIF